MRFTVCLKTWLFFGAFFGTSNTVPPRVRLRRPFCQALVICGDDQKLNFVLDSECCCEQPISKQKFFVLQFHWMLTTTTFTFQHQIQLLLMNHIAGNTHVLQ